MKYKNIISLVLTLAVIVISCNKHNLTQTPIGLLDETDLANKDGVEGLLIGAYSLLDGYAYDNQPGGVGNEGTSPANWIYGSICGTEAYVGSQQTDQQEMRNIEKFSAGPNDYYFDSKWQAIYSGVARANTVLRVMRQAHDMSTDDTVQVRAEALFLRAFYHFEAKKLWNNIPLVDENVTYNAGNYYLNNDTSWTLIENDLLYAMNNLRAVKAPAIGRANKYAAEAFLAKAYLFEHRYADAQILLTDLIQNGVTAGGIKYGLARYADNFNIEFKNQQEAVFSVQASVNDGAAGNNGNASEELNFPLYSAGYAPGGCCGFFQPSQYLVNHFKTDPATGLPDPDIFNNTDLKNDEDTSSFDPFKPYSATIDPRLDWTVGRRGVPYLDWGPHPGMAWIRDQHFSGPYNPIKNVYKESQQARFTDPGYWLPTLVSANNFNLIRFADILLWAAEVEVELGNFSKATDYVNMIRQRAADATGWVSNDNNIPYAKAVTNNQLEFDAINDPSFTNINPLDWVVRKELNQTWVFLKTDDGGNKIWNAYTVPNYKINIYTTPFPDKEYGRKAVRYERMLELGMEGHRFFDLVRWGIADQEINAYLQQEQKQRTYLGGAVFIKGKNEYYPIPQNQINLSIDQNGIQHLKQNPGY